MLCLLGPTASGKSAMAMALARSDPRIEIISLDSAQVYRGMDIGTAKPDRHECESVRHHLIDLIDPAESFSAARFVDAASRAAREIRQRGGIPLMVGGTMLYYKAYTEGLDDLPSAPAPIRDAIREEASARGWPALHERLKTIDPETAGRLHPADAQRISRALELHAATGRTMSELIRQSSGRKDAAGGNRETLTTVALLPENRALLHDRIRERFMRMLAQGFLDEVRALMARGDLAPTLPSMRCVGYRQAWDYLSGGGSQDDFIEAGIAATRQLAKRQITWIRSFQNVLRIDPWSPEGLAQWNEVARTQLASA
jgi:tRNA dimethylallyltransferase